MNKSTEHSNDAVMVAHQRGFNQQEWNRQQYKAALMVMITMVACGILLASPSYLSARYTCMVMSIGPAIYMTGYPHDFICPKCGRRSGEQFGYVDDCDDADDDFESWEGFAQFCDEQDYPGLVKYCEAEVARRPANLSAHYDLGKAYVLNGQYQEAIDSIAECYRQRPGDVNFQHVILDALFALGKTEADFPWVTVPTVIRLDAALIDYYYEYLRPKRKPRSVEDLRTEQYGRGYVAFSNEELRQAFAHDDRFEVDTDRDCYWAEVKVRRRRQRNRNG